MEITQERREALAQQIYSKPWDDCYWRQQEAIDTRILAEAQPEEGASA